MCTIELKSIRSKYVEYGDIHQCYIFDSFDTDLFNVLEKIQTINNCNLFIEQLNIKPLTDEHIDRLKYLTTIDLDELFNLNVFAEKYGNANIDWYESYTPIKIHIFKHTNKNTFSKYIFSYLFNDVVFVESLSNEFICINQPFNDHLDKYFLLNKIKSLEIILNLKPTHFVATFNNYLKNENKYKWNYKKVIDSINLNKYSNMKIYFKNENIK